MNKKKKYKCPECGMEYDDADDIFECDMCDTEICHWCSHEASWDEDYLSTDLCIDCCCKTYESIDDDDE